MRYRFPKSFHLCAESHFQAFFKSARRVENKLVRLYFRPALRDRGKVAFVASKKTGNSVVRNRCKRIMREVFRLNQHQIDFTLDYVAVAKTGHLFSSYFEVDVAFQQLFRRIQTTVVSDVETETS